MPTAPRLPNVHRRRDAPLSSFLPWSMHHHQHHHHHHHHQRMQQQVLPNHHHHHQSYLHQHQHHTLVYMTPDNLADLGYFFYPTRQDASNWSGTGYFYPGYHWEVQLGPAQSTRSDIRNNQEAEQTIIWNSAGVAAPHPPATTSRRNWIHEDDTLIFVTGGGMDDPSPTTRARGDGGVSEDTILRYLKTRQAVNYQHDQDEICVICQDNLFHEDHDRVSTLNCKHEFHFDCIKNWLTCKNSCPLCKATAIETATQHSGRNN